MFADISIVEKKRMKKQILFFLITLIIIQQIIVLPGCANIIPPSGGLRDSLPPRLVSAIPRDSALNFKGNKLVLTFDEFVEVQNVHQNLIVSPVPQANPIVEYKLRTVTIKLKDSLEDNTTYTFNFGEAIKDINEGNSLKNFTYFFSTGGSIDSLELKGKVLLAETGKTDSTLIVILHKSSDDSAVINNKPRYITRLDGQGNFNFKNLPARFFYIYAMKDEAGAGKLLGRNQLFAFADKPVESGKEIPNFTLYAYPENIAPVAAAVKTEVEGKDKRLRYQVNLQNNQQDLLNDLEFYFDAPLLSYDSSKIRFASDSAFNIVPDFKWTKDTSNKKITLSGSWKENTLYHIILDKDFAADSLGRKLLKTDTLSFKTKKLTDYGSISLRFKNLNLLKNPFLFFVVNNAVVKSFTLNSEIFYQKLFVPGDYELRILNDDNKNGKWDPGEFFGKHKKQPEIVKPIDRRIIIKPNWDNEMEITIPSDSPNGGG